MDFLVRFYFYIHITETVVHFSRPNNAPIMFTRTKALKACANVVVNRTHELWSSSANLFVASFERLLLDQGQRAGSVS